MITFCSGPVAAKREEDQASATEYEFYICNAAKRHLGVTASLPYNWTQELRQLNSTL